MYFLLKNSWFIHIFLFSFCRSCPWSMMWIRRDECRHHPHRMGLDRMRSNQPSAIYRPGWTWRPMDHRCHLGRYLCPSLRLRRKLEWLRQHRICSYRMKLIWLELWLVSIWLKRCRLSTKYHNRWPIRLCRNNLQNRLGCKLEWFCNYRYQKQLGTSQELFKLKIKK